MGVVRAYVAVSAGVPMTSFLQKKFGNGWAFQTPAVQKNYGTENLSEPRRSFRYRTPIGVIL